MGALGCRLPAGGRGKLLPLDVVEITALLPLPEGDHGSDRREDRRELEELPEEALLLLSRSFAVVAQGKPSSSWAWIGSHHRPLSHQGHPKGRPSPRHPGTAWSGARPGAP